MKPFIGRKREAGDNSWWLTTEISDLLHAEVTGDRNYGAASGFFIADAADDLCFVFWVLYIVKFYGESKCPVK